MTSLHVGLLLAVAAMLLVGCVGSPDTNSTTPPSTDELQPAKSNGDAQGSQSSSDTSRDEPANSTAVLIERKHLEGDKTMTHQVGVCPNNGWCVGAFHFVVTEFRIPENASNLQATATWAPVNPTVEQLNVWIGDEGETIATMNGPSPISLKADGPLTPGEHYITVLLSKPGGAFVNQDIHWTVDFDVKM